MVVLYILRYWGYWVSLQLEGARQSDRFGHKLPPVLQRVQRSPPTSLVMSGTRAVPIGKYAFWYTEKNQLCGQSLRRVHYRLNSNIFCFQ